LGNDSIFVDDFIARMGFLRFRMHASPVEAVSLMIFDSAAIEFLLMIS